MIMDGNKRWSKLNNVSLKEGYLKGLYKIKEIAKICIEKNIKHLTLFALSSENIKRPSVSIIFDILYHEYNNLLKEFEFKNYIKIKIIGEREGISSKICNIFNNIENKTKENKKLNLNIAFNYGTNKELLSIINNIIKIHKSNKIIINEDLLKNQMYLSNTPDPDLLIRTGGFQRLSNFLLLKLSYTELFFTKTLWPDLDKEELLDIFSNYKNVERNYGL